MPEKSYIAINSFPKSGNTWLRQFIACLCFGGDLADVPDHYSTDISGAPAYRLPDGREVRFYRG